MAAFCRSNGIRKLSLFGSVLTDRFMEESDVDVLVEFERSQRIGYFKMAALERELTGILRSALPALPGRTLLVCGIV